MSKVVKKEIVSEAKPEARVPFTQLGKAYLFKSRDAKAEDAKGVIIRTFKEGTNVVDYSATACLIWFSSLDKLRSGQWVDIQVYAVPPRPLNGD